MVPSIDETGLNELKRLTLGSFDELECIIDTTQQQDVASTAFSNLVDLSLRSCDGLREICSGGRPPRGFIENLETLDIRYCNNMSSIFPSWVLIQRLRKLKKVTVWWCGELEDVFQLEGLCYAKENPFLLSSLESLDLWGLRNLRYIWKGPTQQVSLQSLTVVEVNECDQLRYLFTLSLARSLSQLEQLTVKLCKSLKHIVEIKEAEENVGGGGGNDVIFPKLRILTLDGLENFISFFYSQNYSSTWPALQELSLYLPLNSTMSFVAQLEANVLQKLRVLEVGIISDQLCNSVLAQLIHGFQNLEELKIRECRVQVLSQLELSLPSLKVLELGWLEELECLCKGPTHLLSLPNLKKLSVRYCNRLRHMFSPSLARNLLQLEELFILYCGELEQIFTEDDIVEYNQALLKDHLQSPLLFPNLSSIDISNCGKLKSVFPVSIAHLLSLQNLTTLELSNCDGLTHLFSSTLARNLLQLESIDIMDCGELEQIIVEDHTEDHHVQVGLFPNLSSISVYKCGKLKTLFPTVTIARSDFQSTKIDPCMPKQRLRKQARKMQIWNSPLQRPPGRFIAGNGCLMLFGNGYHHISENDKSRMHVKLEHGCLLVNQLVHHEDIIWKALLSEKACLIQGRYCCLNLYLLAIVYCSWYFGEENQSAVTRMDSGNRFTGFSVELLSQSNYKIWKTCMEYYLVGEDLLDVIGGGKTKAPKNTIETADEIKEVDGGKTDALEDTIETSDEFKKWLKMNAKVEFVLKRSISHSLFKHIMRCKSASEIWATLSSLFNKKDVAQLQMLENELGNSTQGDLSISQFFLKIKTLCSEISLLD
ncbi:hypothetical protein LWI29_033091 [Acer saccharum]|uniref:Disease resistance protein At4g27190-like leucine-rich repeats domain-containing protein n=1 Tax=Acer saccharum TaxID=4024 RepID=A0AA39W3E6_ACESA|nr:hypothetical protein LWI29_033091 [Acer saccharum]